MTTCVTHHWTTLEDNLVLCKDVCIQTIATILSNNNFNIILTLLLILETLFIGKAVCYQLIGLFVHTGTPRRWLLIWPKHVAVVLDSWTSTVCW